MELCPGEPFRPANDLAISRTWAVAKMGICQISAKLHESCFRQENIDRLKMYADVIRFMAFFLSNKRRKYTINHLLYGNN